MGCKIWNLLLLSTTYYVWDQRLDRNNYYWKCKILTSWALRLQIWGVWNGSEVLRFHCCFFQLREVCLGKVVEVDLKRGPQDESQFHDSCGILIPNNVMCVISPTLPPPVPPLHTAGPKVRGECPALSFAQALWPLWPTRRPKRKTKKQL